MHITLLNEVQALLNQRSGWALAFKWGKNDLLHKQELHSSDGAASIMANGILSEGLYNLLVTFVIRENVTKLSQNNLYNIFYLLPLSAWSSEKLLPDMRLLTKQSQEAWFQSRISILHSHVALLLSNYVNPHKVLTFRREKPLWDYRLDKASRIFIKGMLICNFYMHPCQFTYWYSGVGTYCSSHSGS